MNILITGGAGFIGYHLVQRLLTAHRGLRLTVLDNFSSPVGLLPESSRVQVIEADIRDAEACYRAVGTADSVVHLGAVSSVPSSLADPQTTDEVNVRGTLNLLEAARRHSVRHFIFASSSAVYGADPVQPKHEQLAPRALSPYAASKLAGEGYASSYTASYGLPTLTLRFFNVFGPMQRADHPYAAVIPKFLEALRGNESPVVYGDGEQTRDFVPVSAVCDVVEKALFRGIASQEPVNVATGQSTTLNELVRQLSILHGKPVPAQYVQERPGEVRHSAASVERLNSFFPDLEGVHMAASLRETYDWYMSRSSRSPQASLNESKDSDSS